MKKFAEYIIEGAPEGDKPEEVLGNKKSKIAEERLRLINEAVLKMGPKRPIASSIGRVVGRLGSRVKDKLNRPIARPLGRAVGRLGMGAKDKLKTYAGEVGSEMRSSLGMGIGLNVANRLSNVGRRKKYEQPQSQQSQMPGNEKLQPRSSGGY